MNKICILGNYYWPQVNASGVRVGSVLGILKKRHNIESAVFQPLNKKTINVSNIYKSLKSLYLSDICYFYGKSFIANFPFLFIAFVLGKIIYVDYVEYCENRSNVSKIIYKLKSFDEYLNLWIPSYFGVNAICITQKITSKLKGNWKSIEIIAPMVSLQIERKIKSYSDNVEKIPDRIGILTRLKSQMELII